MKLAVQLVLFCLSISFFFFGFFFLAMPYIVVSFHEIVFVVVSVVPWYSVFFCMFSVFYLCVCVV